MLKNKNVPGVDPRIPNTTSFGAKRHNSEKVPWLRAFEIGRFLFAFYYVSHVEGASRVTLRKTRKMRFHLRRKLTEQESFPSSPPAQIWSDLGMKSNNFALHWLVL